MKRNFWLILAGLVMGLVIVFGAWYLAQRNYRYQGSLIDPPVSAADFELVDQSGGTFRLSNQKGKILLIFFGYTHCPDVCPVTLSKYSMIKSQLEKQAANVEFLFITVDPERDTVEQIHSYLGNIDPGFVGLTGTRSELESVWKDYGVYQQSQAADANGNYVVDHTSRVYLVDGQGNWRLTYPFEAETSAIISDLRHLLATE
jgi:protein SCO1/2